MKKLLLVLTVALLCIGLLAACGGDTTTTAGKTNTTGEKGDTTTAPATSGQEAHTHDYTAVVTAPTCTEKGYTTYTCACGDSYVGDEVEALGHDYAAVVTEPTCTEKGYTTYTCACGDSYVSDEVEALGHDYAAVVTAPSCTEKGYTTYTCSCGDSYVGDEVEALGHDYTAVVTEPTCTEKGYTTYTCACGDSYVSDEAEALGHTEAIDAAVEATCTESGLTEGKHCAVCGEVLVAQETVETLGHSYNTTDNAGTVGSTITYTCENCNDTYDLIVEEIVVSVWLSGTSSATMNGYGSFSKTYSVSATGGWGSYQFKYEVYTSATATEPYEKLTVDFCESNSYSISYRGYEDAISGYILQVTVQDEAGNQAVYRYEL